MRKILLIALAFLIVIPIACRDVKFSRNGYKKAVRSGLNKIPEASQIEELLGDADHFISYSGSRSVGNVWNTEVHFKGRYVLTMQVPVRIGANYDEVIEVLDEPKFYLGEIREVIYSGGNIGTETANNDWDYPLTLDDWKKVYQADGDFSVIGIHLKENQPVKDFEKFVQAVRRDRVKVEKEEE